MELLSRLEKQACNIWRQASETRNPTQRQQLLAQYRELYGKYKKQKAWIQTLNA
mgnify:CR=1 FL=1